MKNCQRGMAESVEEYFKEQGVVKLVLVHETIAKVQNAYCIKEI